MLLLNECVRILNYKILSGEMMYMICQVFETITPEITLIMAFI